jgi:hypothetical protein
LSAHIELRTAAAIEALAPLEFPAFLRRHCLDDILGNSELLDELIVTRTPPLAIAPWLALRSSLRTTKMSRGTLSALATP